MSNTQRLGNQEKSIENDEKILKKKQKMRNTKIIINNINNLNQR